MDYWMGFVLGFLTGGTIIFIAATMYIVIGGHGPKGKARIMAAEAERVAQGERWEDAEPRREARRQVLIKEHMKRIEENQSAAAQR